MQIRELDLKELQSVYDVVKQLRTKLSYKEFEDLIYDMRSMNYKMIGILDSNVLVSYAGVAVQTNLYHKRHLFIFDLVTDEKHRSQGHENRMLEYLVDYAKVALCENIVLSSEFYKEEATEFRDSKDFIFLK